MIVVFTFAYTYLKCMPIKKTYTQKLNESKVHKIKTIDFDFADIPANSTMLIASPKIIDDYVNQIPKGKIADVKKIRRDLAASFNADYTCPVTTGIYLRVVAEAAYEKYVSTKSIKKITPFWRAIDPKSALAKKLSCGAEFISERLNEEN